MNKRKIFIAVQSEEEARRLMDVLTSAGFDAVYQKIHSLEEFSQDNESSTCDFIIIDSSLTRQKLQAQKKKSDEELSRIQQLESLGILVGGIAHDFNNVFTGILGNISLAKLYSKNAKNVLDKLNDAEKAVVKGRELSGQILTFAKGGDPVKETSSLSDIIREACTNALRGSNVLHIFSIPDDLWLADVDRAQIRQAVQNVVINGAQAMPDGGMIDISAENEIVTGKSFMDLQEGKYLKISIKDHGLGIHAEHFSKIFDPYFTTKKKGMGLGLPLTQSIIRKHGGQIIVDSEEGTGTTVIIYLPASPLKKIPVPDIGQIAAKTRGKILLMDDDIVIRKVGAEILRYLGYEVETARDGTDAIERFQKAIKFNSPFDLLILDLTVPGGMGAKETIRRIRELDPFAKAIVSSGYTNDPIMSNYEQFGFTDFVPKPYEIEQLSAAVKKIFSEK
jgi:signal transduction histidine kinase/ActR/RegA family two-component response regulator